MITHVIVAFFGRPNDLCTQVFTQVANRVLLRRVPGILLVPSSGGLCYNLVARSR
jgi:hypothetical protein